MNQARGMIDEDIIEKAHLENWILITNDKGFGEKVFREGRPYRGVVFFRLEDERAVIKVVSSSNKCDGYLRDTQIN